ncbi:MAG: hypothetical protein ACOCY0_02695 [Roseicyclus sp.]
MAEFLRPGAVAALRKWREVLAALGLVALGLWIAAFPGPVVQGFGWVLVAVGTAVLIPASRRARFAASGEAPGVVNVVERRILYMGPTHGGAVALDDIDHLSIRRMEDGRAAWILVENDSVLAIPVEAAGAEALFDAFTALPGLSAKALLAARDASRPGTTRLWSRGRALPPGRTLTR